MINRVKSVRGKETKLGDLPLGLFFYSNYLCLKHEMVGAAKGVVYTRVYPHSERSLSPDLPPDTIVHAADTYIY